MSFKGPDFLNYKDTIQEKLIDDTIVGLYDDVVKEKLKFASEKDAKDIINLIHNGNRELAKTYGKDVTKMNVYENAFKDYFEKYVGNDKNLKFEKLPQNGKNSFVVTEKYGLMRRKEIVTSNVGILSSPVDFLCKIFNTNYYISHKYALSKTGGGSQKLAKKDLDEYARFTKNDPGHEYIIVCDGEYYTETKRDDIKYLGGSNLKVLNSREFENFLYHYKIRSVING